MIEREKIFVFFNVVAPFASFSWLSSIFGENIIVIFMCCAVIFSALKLIETMFFSKATNGFITTEKKVIGEKERKMTFVTLTSTGQKFQQGRAISDESIPYK